MDLSDEDLDAVSVIADGDLLEGVPRVLPLAWSLAYQYPVHLIGEKFRPQQAAKLPNSSFIGISTKRWDSWK